MTEFIFGCIEDYPQFLLQGLNSYMLGRTLTPIQIVSPLLSLYGFITKVVMSRVFIVRPKDSRIAGFILTLCFELACLLPLLLIGL